MATRNDSRHLFSVEGIVAVITGGGSGLGLMMANILAKNGARKVFIIGRNIAKLEQAASSHSGIIIPIQGDVTSQESLQAAALRVRNDTGYINILIPNAGISGPGVKGMSPRATIGEFVQNAWNTPMSQFNDVYDTNCTGVYYTILSFLELLNEGNLRRQPNEPKSQVIAMSSMVAFQRDPRYGFAYCTSKAALISLIKCFATHCVMWDIRFNAIAAGLFPTDMSGPAMTPFKVVKDKEVTEEGAFAKSFIPAERAGSENDIAGVLLYLASQAGSYVNGSVMLMDGGKLATVPATY